MDDLGVPLFSETSIYCKRDDCFGGSKLLPVRMIGVSQETGLKDELFGAICVQNMFESLGFFFAFSWAIPYASCHHPSLIYHFSLFWMLSHVYFVLCFLLHGIGITWDFHHANPRLL